MLLYDCRTISHHLAAICYRFMILLDLLGPVSFDSEHHYFRFSAGLIPVLFSLKNFNCKVLMFGKHRYFHIITLQLWPLLRWIALSINTFPCHLHRVHHICMSLWLAQETSISQLSKLQHITAHHTCTGNMNKSKCKPEGGDQIDI